MQPCRALGSDQVLACNLIAGQGVVLNCAACCPQEHTRRHACARRQNVCPASSTNLEKNKYSACPTPVCRIQTGTHAAPGRNAPHTRECMQASRLKKGGTDGPQCGERKGEPVQVDKPGSNNTRLHLDNTAQRKKHVARHTRKAKIRAPARPPIHQVALFFFLQGRCTQQPQLQPQDCMHSTWGNRQAHVTRFS